MELTSLLPLVKELCPSVINAVAKKQLGLAYREFCVESKYVLRTETFEREQSVTLRPDVHHYVNSIALVTDGHGNELERGSDYVVHGTDVVTTSSTYSKLIVTFSIAPLLPIHNEIFFENSILERWPEKLANGAAYKLRMLPNKEWTDFELANYYKALFVTGYREAYRLGQDAVDELNFQKRSKRNFY